jgi:acyl-CoA reductase-like NAD-dependent aldehyde dehydrogenase
MTTEVSAPRTLPVAGKRIEGHDPLTVRSPFTGDEVGQIGTATAQDMSRAVAAAAAALNDPMPPWQRAEILDRAAALVRERAEDIAALMVAELAKPVRLARAEVTRTAATLSLSADEARRLAGTGIPLSAAQAGAGMTGFTMPMPIGVVGGIIPFNFPAVLTAHKIGPAVAAGCPIVLLLAAKAPLTALAVAQCVLDAGLPAERLSALVGNPAALAEVLLTDDAVRLISFTGSPDIGWALQARARRKRVVLELGNISPIIVCADGDYETAARAAAIGGNAFAGQSCISVQRLIVDQRVIEPFRTALTEHLNALSFGDPELDSTDLGPMITPAATRRAWSDIEASRAMGARIVRGGLDLDGHLHPLLIDQVTPDMPVWRKEAFAPVLAMRSFTSLNEAIGLANGTDMGIHASIYTRDIGNATTAMANLEFAGVIVNETPSFRVDQMPYGGIKSSGNTKEGPAYAVAEMTDQRLIAMRSLAAKD